MKSKSTGAHRIAPHRITIQVCSADIGPINSDEPYYDDEEPQEEYYSPEAPDDVEPGENGAVADEDADNIITSGDPSAAAKESSKSHKDKRIPNELRTTTPYMTKYEKARILGTRALQIRYAAHAAPSP